MTGSGIFVSDGENGISESDSANPIPNRRMYQVHFPVYVIQVFNQFIMYGLHSLCTYLIEWSYVNSVPLCI